MSVQDTQSASLELSFCPLCGTELDGGACASHGVPALPPPAGERPGPRAEPHTPGRALDATALNRAHRRPEPTASRWRAQVLIPAGSAVAVLMALAVALVALGDARELRHGLRAADGRIERLDPLTDRVAAAEGGMNGLSRRVSGLEAARDATPDTAEVAARVQRSVFTVVTDGGEGSGWVVSGGHVVTNFHVVADGWVNDRRDVTLRQDDKSWPAKVVDVSAADDLAVIAVEGPFTPLERATVRAKVGDPVLVVGSPLGLGGTVSSGIVSAYRTEAGLEYLQFSAPLSPGNSGGPVVDAAGRVIGVSVAKYVGAGAEGLSFAIPIERACAALSAC